MMQRERERVREYMQGCRAKERERARLQREREHEKLRAKHRKHLELQRERTCKVAEKYYKVVEKKQVAELRKNIPRERLRYQRETER